MQSCGGSSFNQIATLSPLTAQMDKVSGILEYLQASGSPRGPAQPGSSHPG